MFRLPIAALLFLEIELMDLNLTLRKLGYVPVAVIDHVDDAVPLAEALIAGGVNSIEVTLRTGAGLASIKADRKSTRLNSSHHRLSRMPSSA